MRIRIITSILFIVVGCMIVLELWGFLEETETLMQEFQLENTNIFLEGDEISALLAMEDSLWVGGKDGVKRVDYETGEVIDVVVSDVTMVYAAGIHKSQQDGSIWIGHNEGVTILRSDGSRLDICAPQMSGGRVNTILETEEKIYIGTMQGCTTFMFDQGTWLVEKILDVSVGLASNPVNVLYDGGESMWFGSYLDTDPGGISILESENTWSYLSLKEGLPHPYINAICEYGDSIFVGTGQLTAGGMAQIDYVDGRYQVKDIYDVADGIPGEKIRHLYVDTSGYFWITTESDGLIICESIEDIQHPIHGVTLSDANGLSDDEIKCIVESETAYWLGGRYGLTRIAKETIKTLVQEDKEDGKES